MSLIIILFGLADFAQASTSLTQPENIWTPAQSIPFYTDIYPPYLIADRDRTVHAFNAQLGEDRKPVIKYRQWRLNQGWSRPYDILIPHTDEPYSLEGAMLDQDGKFHLILFGGFLEEDTGTIDYSAAWASLAEQPKAWSDIVTIAKGAGPIISASLAGDGKEELYVVYTGHSAGLGLYEVHSLDAGKSWSEPIIIKLNNGEEVPTNIQLEVDPNNNLHAVWGVVDAGGLGIAGYYARRDATLGTWSVPVLLAAKEGNDYAADWPSIIYFHDELIVLYQDGSVPYGNPPTRWMRRSSDDGYTWSMPVQPFPQEGGYGAAVLQVDGNDTLHIIAANRIGNPAISGVWHGIWLGDIWDRLELITASTSEQADVNGSYGEITEASRPSAVISQGNIFLATWWHDMLDQPPAGYSYTALDAPEYSLEPLPSPTIMPTKSPPVTIEELTTPVETPTPTIKVEVSGSADVEASSPTDIITISVLSVILLILSIFIVYRFYLSSRYK